MPQLKDTRLIGLGACVLAFLAGKFSLDRVLPFVAGWPEAILDIRTPLMIVAVLAAMRVFYRDGRLAFKSGAYLLPLASYAVFCAGYALLPFPLTHAGDIGFAALGAALFAILYTPAYRRLLEWGIVGLSTLLIAAAIALTPHGQALQFAGSAATFVRVIGLATLLLVFMPAGRLRLALLIVHGFALAASTQITAFVALAVLAMTIPAVLAARGIGLRAALSGIGMIALGCAIGVAVASAPLAGKIAFRMKTPESAAVLETPATHNSSAFPGGLKDTAVVRNGENFTLKLPDFEKDTRVCIDDRSDRIKLFATALSMHAQSQSRWGWGDSAFAMPLTRFQTLNIHTHPHNILLEVLVVRGPYVLLAFCALVYACALQTLIATVRQPNLAAYAAGMAFIALTSLWSGDFYDFRWFFMLMVVPVVDVFGPRRSQDL